LTRTWGVAPGYYISRRRRLVADFCSNAGVKGLFQQLPRVALAKAVAAKRRQGPLDLSTTLAIRAFGSLIRKARMAFRDSRTAIHRRRIDIPCPEIAFRLSRIAIRCFRIMVRCQRIAIRLLRIEIQVSRIVLPSARMRTLRSQS